MKSSTRLSNNKHEAEHQSIFPTRNSPRHFNIWIRGILGCGSLCGVALHLKVLVMTTSEKATITAAILAMVFLMVRMHQFYAGALKGIWVTVFRP